MRNEKQNANMAYTPQSSIICQMIDETAVLLAGATSRHFDIQYLARDRRLENEINGHNADQQIKSTVVRIRHGNRPRDKQIGSREIAAIHDRATSPG